MIIARVRKEINNRFPDSVVVWIGTGTPSDNYEDNTEVFDAYMIPEGSYEDFVELEWKLRDEIFQYFGINISIRDLTPEETKKYRWEQYLENFTRQRIYSKKAGHFMPKKSSEASCSFAGIAYKIGTDRIEGQFYSSSDKRKFPDGKQYLTRLSDQQLELRLAA